VFWTGFTVMLKLIGMVVFLLPLIFYILTVRRAFESCAPESRTMGPDQVWLLLIPVLGLFWHFYVVVNVARSLGREYQKRGIASDSNPGLSLGLAVCILGVITLTPHHFLSMIAIAAALICWVLYWVKVGDLTAKLTTAPASPPTPATPV
jgi:hypothetical protein